MSDLEARVKSLEGIVGTLEARIEELEKGKKGAKPAPSPAERKAPARPATAAPKTLEKTPSAAKLPGAARGKPALSSGKAPVVDAAGIPDERKGNYSIGKTKVFYVLPDDVKKSDEKVEPKTGLKLEYIYGYNGKNCRQNLFWGKAPNTAVYNVAGSGVVFNVASNTQTHFTKHENDIQSLAVHPSRPIVATGQMDVKGGATPYICIWNEETGEQVGKIVYHDRGIVSLAFSPDGKYLASVGDDDSHTLALWDWEETKTAAKGQNAPLASQMASKDAVYQVAFNPHHNGADYQMVTVGAKAFKKWTVSKEGLSSGDAKARNASMVAKTPSTNEKSKITQKAFHSVAFGADGKIWLGTASGHIYIMGEKDLASFFKAHGDVPVGGLAAFGNNFVSGGEDGTIAVWNAEGKQQASWEIEKIAGEKGSKVRSLSVGANNQALVGTAKNSIIAVDLGNGSAKVLMNGHHDEVSGLAVHPTRPIVLSGGNDNVVRTWNYVQRKQVGRVALKSAARSAHISPDGKHLVVGQGDGKISLLSVDNLEAKASTTALAKETVDVVAFSPDGKLVAAGSNDQNLYILEAPSMKIKFTCKGHSSSVTSLQWSEDSTVIQTVSRDYQILFWSAVTGKMLTKATDYADAKFVEWNCLLGWAVAGIWKGASDGTDINCVVKSPDGRALVAGDDFSMVRLYSFPVLAKDSPFKSYSGHSSFVTTARFNAASDKLFTAGGIDFTLMQWAHA